MRLREKKIDNILNILWYYLCKIYDRMDLS
nr:MAG TPA: hypothetical protein [Caudoviricetes sp.]